MTDSSLPDMRAHPAAEQIGERSRRRRTYLPSAQVLTELATLGPDLARLADDLRDRLSGPGDDAAELAARSAGPLSDVGAALPGVIITTIA